MIHGVYLNNPIPSIDYILNASVGGKISLPVEPTSLVYSHFKHVSGVAAPEGSKGVAISKLNILDILIEQINQIKNAGNPADSVQVPEDKWDTMIEAFSGQIRQAKEAHAAMPYIPAPMAETGAVFNFMI